MIVMLVVSHVVWWNYFAERYQYSLAQIMAFFLACVWYDSTHYLVATSHISLCMLITSNRLIPITLFTSLVVEGQGSLPTSGSLSMSSGNVNDDSTAKTKSSRKSKLSLRRCCRSSKDTPLLGQSSDVASSTSSSSSSSESMRQRT
jgi:hypothetical protein